MGQQTSYIVEDDFPPKRNINEWSDKEFLDRISNLETSSLCAYIPQSTAKWSETTAQNMIDENGSDWVSTLYGLCALTYIDKSFYHCMSNLSSDPPLQALTAFEQMQQRHTGEKVTENEMSSDPFVSHASQCLQANHQFEELRNRANRLESDVALQNRAYLNFWLMSQSSPYQVTKIDTREEVKQKTQNTMTDRCKYHVDVKNLESPSKDNVLNYVVLLDDANTCLLSNVCANNFRKCMERGISFPQCKQDRGVQNCAKFIERVSNLKEQT